MKTLMAGLAGIAILAALVGACTTMPTGSAADPRSDPSMSGAGALTTPPDVARRPDMGGVIVGAGGTATGATMGRH